MKGSLKSKIIIAVVVVATTLYLIACTTPTKIIENLKQDEFEIASPDQLGLNTTVLARADSLVSNQVYPNIHSVLIFKDNKLVFEKYYRGKDEIWGNDVGVISFNSDSIHDIRSVTKSIVSALVGIAIDQGKIRSVDQKVFDFFPEYKYLDTGIISTLTLYHLLTMSTGQTWNEEVPYSDSTNSEIRMIRSNDPIAYALRQPIEKQPGTEWRYNGGSTQVLAAIIKKVSGQEIDDFARTFLFHPLGISKFSWIRYPFIDIPAAASGLRMRPRDLLKFGMLYINEGKHNGNRVISKSWIDQSTQVQLPLKNAPDSLRIGYGYQFWIRTINHPLGYIPLAVAIGNGNQRIFIDRKNQMVTVVTAGNYNNWGIKNNSDKLVFDLVYEALVK